MKCKSVITIAYNIIYLKEDMWNAGMINTLDLMMKESGLKLSEEKSFVMTVYS